MTARYIAKPRLWWDAGAALFDDAPADSRRVEVYEDERKPEPTGLLDAHGLPLYRVCSKEPIGFIKPK
jgi:hypothetical protein